MNVSSTYEHKHVFSVVFLNEKCRYRSYLYVKLSRSNTTEEFSVTQVNSLNHVH